TKDDGSIVEPAAGSFLRLLWPTVAATFANLSAAAPSTEAKEARKIRRVGTGWIVPAPPPAVIWTRREIESIASVPITFEWVGDRLRHAGPALHGLLQRIA